MSREEELAKALGDLVATRFGGARDVCFRFYDRDGDGAINAEELRTLLYDAGIGSPLTRQMWVSGILAKVDADRDGRITWAEFQTVTRGK